MKDNFCSLFVSLRQLKGEYTLIGFAPTSLVQ